MSDAYWLALGILAAWRLTHLIQAEDVPWDIVVRARRTVSHRIQGRLMDCFHCVSVWVAAPLALAIGDSWPERALLWPALSGGAILAQRLSAPRSLPATWIENQEEHDVVLREGVDIDHPAEGAGRSVAQR